MGTTPMVNASGVTYPSLFEILSPFMPPSS